MKTKKAMKKITHIGMAALVAMGMLGTSCNKAESPEIETPETQKENIVTLTTTVGFAADDTKALDINYTDKKLTKTFAAGEQVVLTYEDQDGNNQNTVSQALTDEDISADGKSAKLTFTLTNPKADGSITYKYPASMFEDNGHVKTSYFFAQNGTLTDVATRDYAGYDGSFAGTNLPASATLDNEIAVVAFTLYKSDGTTDITNTITGMTIEVSGVTYTITPSGLDKIYVAMWPEDGSEITITATDGSKNYTKTLTSKTYAKGQFYQQGLKMTAAPARPLAEATTDDLGKIAGADGNIYDTKAEAEAAGTQAVAMIAYVGSKTDNFAHKYGIAIALSDEGGKTWSTAKSTCEGKNTSLAVTGGTWMLPSQDQWKAMFKATSGSEGNYANLNTALATAGDELKKDGSYWSSTPYDGGRAWFVRLIDAQWRYDSMDYSLRVRACLVFGDYTARPLAEATTDDLGKIAGADGYIYDTKAAAEAAGTQAVAMIAYVGSETDHSTYKHGLAITLSNEGEKDWSTAKSICEGKTAVSGAAWMLPSENQWKTMFKANGGNEAKYDGLNTALGTAGGDSSKLQEGTNDDCYWSSTPCDDSRYARCVYFNGGDTHWTYYSKLLAYYIRACLAF